MAKRTNLTEALLENQPLSSDASPSAPMSHKFYLIGASGEKRTDSIVEFVQFLTTADVDSVYISRDVAGSGDHVRMERINGHWEEAP
jgi:hypothetical protein